MSLTQLITIPHNNRYLFYEVTNQGFSEEKEYVIDGFYQGNYQIQNKGITRTLEIRNSEDFSINGYKEITIPKTTFNFTLNFSPKKIAPMNLELVLKPIGREVEIQLVKRTLQVQQQHKIIKIEGHIRGSLPPRMKLGDQRKIIFLFSNKGNQAVEGVNIKIKTINESYY